MPTAIVWPVSEGPVAVAQQDRDGALQGVGDGEVEPAVVGEVGADHGDLRRAGGDRLGESRTPLHRGSAGRVTPAGLVVRHGDIGPAVAVKVGDGQRVGLRVRRGPRSRAGRCRRRCPGAA